ncbi:MAG TPA: helix-hairpin-helix domain-containing protein [Candidatus Limnocylindria bacterium]|nr:helix-hairpin-helix domain-containing protein [Candidatus Limnocylindria bacterium]
MTSLTRRDQLAIGLAAGGLLCVAGAAWLLVGAAGAAPAPSEGQAFPSLSPATQASPSLVSTADLVIDVQGAVRRPGVVLLPPGARVADALSAAGGYSGQADLNAAASSLNLAALLTDGAQVYVPIIGATAPGTGSGTGGGGTIGGGGGSTLVNVNTATPEELEALPGIGPVTVQKIVAGRAQQAFATLDEMVEREVIDRGQLEDIRDLVTF